MEAREKVLVLSECEYIADKINEKVEYFRKKGKIIKDQILTDQENGNQYVVPGGGRRSRGKLKGVMVAYVPDGDDVVRVGFSMCHPNDNWDYVNGVKVHGWGKQIARERGEKWVSKEFIQPNMNLNEALKRCGCSDSGIEMHLKQTVIVPDSMLDSLREFIERCHKYYKDKRFPAWANQLLSDKCELPSD